MSSRSTLLIVAALMALLLSACYPNPQPLGLTPIPSLAPGSQVTLAPEIQGVATSAGATIPATSQSDAAVGAPIFLKNCTPCHGAQGEGVDAPALRNSQYVQTARDQALFATIANGRAGTEMPAWLQANGGPLTAVEIANAIAYLHTLQNVSALPSATPAAPEPTKTPLPPNAPTPEPALPSNPGQAGTAASMIGDVGRGQSDFGVYCAACHGPEGVQGVPNPDSDDGAVPALNPIDSTIVNVDPKMFALNLDLFIEHGSVPAGSGPMILMPSFGDGRMLTVQQIADLIAYVMHLNGVEQSP